MESAAQQVYSNILIRIWVQMIVLLSIAHTSLVPHRHVADEDEEV
jgi:hypothetical protein